MGEHLHLIREKMPTPKPEYKMFRVYCPECKQYVWIIHLDLPPENPKEKK